MDVDMEKRDTSATHREWSDRSPSDVQDEEPVVTTKTWLVVVVSWPLCMRKQATL